MWIQGAHAFRVCSSFVDPGATESGASVDSVWPVALGYRADASDLIQTHVLFPGGPCLQSLVQLCGSRVDLGNGVCPSDPRRFSIHKRTPKTLHKFGIRDFSNPESLSWIHFIERYIRSVFTHKSLLLIRCKVGPGSRDPPISPTLTLVQLKFTSLSRSGL